MKIHQLKTNQIVNPLGFALDSVSLSYQVESDQSQAQKTARIEVSLSDDFNELLFDSGTREDINSVAFPLDMAPLLPRTRYYWRVTVTGDQGDQTTSEAAWFETAKGDEPWAGQWIASAEKDWPSARFQSVCAVNSETRTIKTIRAYCCGLGCYELWVNGTKAGNEYLAPGFHAYDKWLQYQTYDLTPLMTAGDNEIEIWVGNGWYKGRLGFNQGGKINFYGDKLQVIADIIVTYDNGDEQVFSTGADWQVSAGPVRDNGIYDGECYDRTWCPVDVPCVLADQSATERLQARLSLPVVIHDTFKPVEVIHLSADTVILDFGQNLSGWVEFDDQNQPGETLHFRYAEVMQGGDIYTENLRSAKTEFTYVSDGRSAHIRPHFTFFGFRFVKITGPLSAVNVNNMTACHVYSDIERRAWLDTTNPTVNQFVENVIRSQKDNFVDLPTDCPQRDERMGWTGDIQVFSSAACMNMGVYAFLTKYLFDLAKEQQEMDGAVPFIVPMFDVKEAGSCAWGDAATVIPWNLWLHYGDGTILARQYSSMKAWVDYIERCVQQQDGDSVLWSSGFHFGDWLALDNEPWIKSFKGKTEDKLVASVYFHYSAWIVAKTAQQLGYEEDAVHYQQLAEQILQALRDEYLTPTGKLALDTQTAFILAIMFDIYPPEMMARARIDFEQKLARDQFRIRSGFVGTPYFCRALTKVGLNDVAYRMFLNTQSPSWLFPVTVGATSIWERWNSMDEQGRMNPDSSMNSLNHYAFGSVIDWLYKDVCGLRPDEAHPGFKQAIIAPHPNYRLPGTHLTAHTAAGCYEVRCEVTIDNQIQLTVTVPFDCQATIVLPDLSDVAELHHNVAQMNAVGRGDALVMTVPAGRYHFQYTPERNYVPRYSVSMPIRELISHRQTKQILERYIPDIMALPFLEMIHGESLADIADKPFYHHDAATLQTIEKAVSEFVIE